MYSSRIERSSMKQFAVSGNFAELLQPTGRMRVSSRDELQNRKLMLEIAQLEAQTAKIARESTLLVSELRRPATWFSAATALVAVLGLVAQNYDSTTQFNLAERNRRWRSRKAASRSPNSPARETAWLARCNQPTRSWPPPQLAQGPARP